MRVLVAMGRAAERGLTDGDPLPLPLLTCPHPAARSWNQPPLRQAMHDAFAALANVVAGGPPPAPAARAFWPDGGRPTQL